MLCRAERAIDANARLPRIACRTANERRGRINPPEVAVVRVEHIRPYNIDLMSAEKVGNP